MVEYGRGEGKAMNSFDDLHIDPPRGVLEATVYEAIDAVHRDLQGEPGWPESRLDVGHRAELESLWRAMEGAPAGHREWQTHGRGWRYSTRANLLVLWWRDHLSRRHVRVVAGCSHKGARLPTPGPTRPVLACIYPTHTVLVSRHRRFRLLVVCGCGAWGTPAELGWMGPCCGPCFDRGAEEAVAPLGWRADQGAVERLAVSPDGTRVGTWSASGEIEVRELAGGRRLAFCRVRGPAGKVTWEPGGSALAVGNFGCAERAICDEGQELRGLPQPFAYLPEGAGVVVQEVNQQPMLLDGRTGQPIRRYPLRRPAPLDDLAASPDGRLLAGVSNEGLLLWDVQSGWLRPLVPLGACLGPLAFSPDGALVALQARAAFPHVVLVDVRRGRHQATLGASTGALDFAFSPDGTLIASVGEDTLRVWDVPDGVERLSLSLGGGEEGLRSLAFTPDGRLLLLGTTHGAVRVWPTDVLRAE